MSGVTLTPVDMPVISRASMQVMTDGGVAVKYRDGEYQPIWWAAEEAGVNDMRFEKYPLKAHHPHTDEIIQLPRSMQNHHAWVQHFDNKQTGATISTPIGIHKRDICTHTDLVTITRDVFSDDLSVDVESIVVSGTKMVINIPLPLINVMGDEMRCSMVIINDMASGKIMSLLWNTVVRCTNEIPAMMMHGGKDKLIFGTNRGSGVTDARKGLLKSRDVIIHGRERLGEVYEHLAKMQVTSKDVESTTYRIFPDPTLPSANFMQSRDDKDKAMANWRAKRKTQRQMREGIMEVFEGNSDTMSGNKAINEFTYYRMLQAVSEVASKHGNMNNSERVMAQFIGNGKRNQPVAQALSLGIEKLNRQGIFFGSDADKRKKIRSKINMN